MSIPIETIWAIEPHTLAKHEILKRYLGAWFAILGSSFRRILYLDAFCGPGRYSGDEVGSPIIALREALKQSSGRLDGIDVDFVFLDERADRIQHLQNELKSFATIPPNFHLIPQTGQSETEIKELLDNLRARNLQLSPTFAFIDPFGFKGVPFSLVERLLKNPNTEVFVNVMVDSINRFLEHPDDVTRQHIVDLFGTPKALEIAQKSPNRITDLRLLYQQRLQTCAKFVRYFEMRNDSNRPIYYLFFASNHPLGHVKMKEAFWKVDKSSGFCFSDATDPSQPVLFELDETPKLARQIKTVFEKQRLEVCMIQSYVENQTSFLCTHMKSALRILEETKQIKVEEVKSDGKKRHGKSFPENVIVQFG